MPLETFFLDSVCNKLHFILRGLFNLIILLSITFMSLLTDTLLGEKVGNFNFIYHVPNETLQPAPCF